MRKELKRLGNNKRHTFIGEFVRTGYKNSYRTYTPTLMLKNIKLADTDQIITSHVWFNYGKHFLQLGELHEDDLIKFDARVDDYYKGYITSSKHDYDLSRPTKVQFVTPQPGRHPMPTENADIIGYIYEEKQAILS